MKYIYCGHFKITFFGFWNDFLAVHTIVILCPIADVHISVTFSYTYTVGVQKSV